MKIESYRDLIVWQKSKILTVKIYELTEDFPKEELYGLTSQIRRSSVSITSNIAEGRGRGTRKDFVQFLRISLGSCYELNTQLEIGQELPKTKSFNYEEIFSLLEEVTKMLHVMINKLATKS